MKWLSKFIVIHERTGNSYSLKQLREIPWRKNVDLGFMFWRNWVYVGPGKVFIDKDTEVVGQGVYNLRDLELKGKECQECHVCPRYFMDILFLYSIRIGLKKLLTESGIKLEFGFVLLIQTI